MSYGGRYTLADQYGVSLEECAFVGDGSNDIHIAKAVGMSVAFNGEAELRNVSTHAVVQKIGSEDFRAVLDYLLPYEYSKGSAPTRATSV